MRFRALGSLEYGAMPAKTVLWRLAAVLFASCHLLVSISVIVSQENVASRENVAAHESVAAEESTQGSVWERDPYRVRIEVQVQSTPLFPLEQVQLLRDKMQRMAPAFFGGMWRAQLVEAASFEWDNSEATPPPESSSLDGAEKLVRLHIEFSEGEGQYTARQWDLATRSWGQPHARKRPLTADPGREALTTAASVLTQIARVEIDAQGTCRLAIRGGDLLPGGTAQSSPHPSQPWWLAGRKKTDADGLPVLEMIPGVMAVVEEASSNAEAVARLVANQDAGFLSAGADRAELFAIRACQQTRPTRIQFSTPGTNPAPLVGYEVWLSFPHQEGARRLALTDDHGSFQLEALKVESCVVSLGTEGFLAASFPVVPGEAEQLKFTVSIDDNWLQGVQEVSQLENRVTDALAARHADVSLLRKFLVEKSWDKAESQLKTLRDLTLAQELAAQAEGILERLPVRTGAFASLASTLERMRQLIAQSMNSAQCDAYAEEIRRARGG